VHYVDLPVYGTPRSLAWKKHRMRSVDPACAKKTWVLEDHRIAAKNCLLTTRAAKWATVQVGGGRTVSDVAAELTCDWHQATVCRAAHFVNDAGDIHPGYIRRGSVGQLGGSTAGAECQVGGVHCYRVDAYADFTPTRVMVR
jgi:hypothetical protein